MLYVQITVIIYVNFKFISKANQVHIDRHYKSLIRKIREQFYVSNLVSVEYYINYLILIYKSN